MLTSGGLFITQKSSVLLTLKTEIMFFSSIMLKISSVAPGLGHETPHVSSTEDPLRTRLKILPSWLRSTPGDFLQPTEGKKEGGQRAGRHRLRSFNFILAKISAPVEHFPEDLQAEQLAWQNH